MQQKYKMKSMDQFKDCKEMRTDAFNDESSMYAYLFRVILAALE